MKINELHHIVKVNGNRQQSENLQRMAFSIGIYWRGSFGLLDVLIENEKYLVFANGEIIYSKFDNFAIVNDYKQVSYRQMMSIMKQIKFENGINTDEFDVEDEIDYKTKQELKVSCNNLYNENTKLHNTIETINKQLNVLRLTNVKMYDMNNNQAIKIAELTERLTTDEIDYKSKFEKHVEMNKKLTTMNEELLEKQKVLSNEVNNKDAKISRLVCHLEHTRRRRQELKLIVYSKYAENEKLTTMNNIQADRLIELQNEIDKFNADLSQSENEECKQVEYINWLENRIDILKIANDNLTEKCNNFERRINAMNGNHCNCCKSTITTIDTDFEVEETENEKQLKQAMDTLNNQMVKLSIKNIKQRKVIENMGLYINQLMRDIVGLEADKSSLNAQVEQYIKSDIARNIINKQSYSICPKCQLKQAIT